MAILYKFVRSAHHLYALLFGYFWRPCPICGEMFGGHEYGAVLASSLDRGVLVCRKYECMSDAYQSSYKMYSQALFKRDTTPTRPGNMISLQLALDDVVRRLDRGNAQWRVTKNGDVTITQDFEHEFFIYLRELLIKEGGGYDNVHIRT